MIRLVLPIIVIFALMTACGDDTSGVTPPRLYLERTAVQLSVAQYEETTESLRMVNEGEGVLEIIGIAIDLDWISVSDTSFQIDAGHSKTLLITANPLFLSEGFYSAKLTFSTNDPDHKNVLIPVEVTVLHGTYSPITITPLQVTLTLEPGGNTQQELTAENPGTVARQITGIQPSCQWASAEPTAFTLQPGEQRQIVLTVTAEDLAEGQYSGALTIATDDPVVPFITVTVQLTVTTSVTVTRVVVAEEFTGTWCTHCPDAMRGLHELRAVVGEDRLAAVAFHIQDDFDIAENSDRAAYYDVSSVPDVRIDGVLQHLGGNDGNPVDYTSYYDERVLVPPSLSIELVLDQYEAATGLGQVTAGLGNISDSTVDFNLLVYLTGTDSSYSWQGFDHLYFTVLQHVAGSQGAPLSLAPGEDAQRTYDFLVPNSWRGRECELIAMAQDKTSKEIHQGAILKF